jgi:endonuclease/exonuclease/phosphatase family metal-dependent hydrolase
VAVGFPKPAFSYEYEVDAQIAALREYEQTKPGRAIPPKQSDRVLIATWNIANLGVQERRDKDYRLIAEILSWFDLIALQEVNDNLTGIRAIHQHLGADYRLLFSDASGNDERMTFVYDATKLALLEEVGEVAPPPSDYRHITLPGMQQRFDGFDRNPYLATFRTGAFTFSLVNVHLYFGSDSAIARNRRSLEAYAVACWADNRRKSRHAVTSDIIPLGDFNLPQTQPGDPIFDALTKRGLQLPPHSTKIAASIASDNQYDQLAFFPGDTQQNFTGQIGVFDFDGAVFAHLWQTRTRQEFLAYVRHYLSDHRPLWAQFITQP